MTPSPLRRRQFLQSAAPFFVPGAAALGLNGATAASDRIVMAAIGQGARGRFVLGHFLDQKGRAVRSGVRLPRGAAQNGERDCRQPLRQLRLRRVPTSPARTISALLGFACSVSSCS
jgi:hypothetical protein